MAIRHAAREAAKAANDKKYRNQLATDEDDLTGVLAGNLDSRLDGAIGGMEWLCSIVRHRRGVRATPMRVPCATAGGVSRRDINGTCSSGRSASSACSFCDSQS
jgi:hypothetical protein